MNDNSAPDTSLTVLRKTEKTPSILPNQLETEIRNTDSIYIQVPFG